MKIFNIILKVFLFIFFLFFNLLFLNNYIQKETNISHCRNITSSYIAWVCNVNGIISDSKFYYYQLLFLNIGDLENLNKIDKNEIIKPENIKTNQQFNFDIEKHKSLLLSIKNNENKDSFIYTYLKNYYLDNILISKELFIQYYKIQKEEKQANVLIIDNNFPYDKFIKENNIPKNETAYCIVYGDCD